MSTVSPFSTPRASRSLTEPVFTTDSSKDSGTGSKSTCTRWGVTTPVKV